MNDVADETVLEAIVRMMRHCRSDLTGVPHTMVVDERHRAAVGQIVGAISVMSPGLALELVPDYAPGSEGSVLVVMKSSDGAIKRLSDGVSG